MTLPSTDLRPENPGSDAELTGRSQDLAPRRSQRSAVTADGVRPVHLLDMRQQNPSQADAIPPLDPSRLDVTADGAPIMWTVDETAAFLGLARHTLDVWRSTKSGGPVYVRLAGNRIRYLPADVRDWLIAQRRGS
jgi:hypothetical protein